MQRSTLLPVFLDPNADVDVPAASRLELFVVDKANLEEQNERLAKELEDMRAEREKWKALTEASSTGNSDDGVRPGPSPPTLHDVGLTPGSLEIENLRSTIYGQSQTDNDLIARSPAVIQRDRKSSRNSMRSFREPKQSPNIIPQGPMYTSTRAWTYRRRSRTMQTRSGILSLTEVCQQKMLICWE